MDQAQIKQRIDELGAGESCIIESKDEGAVAFAAAHVRKIRKDRGKKLRMTLVNGIARDLQIERLS